MNADLDSRIQARELLHRGRAAFDVLRRFSQQDVDRICYAMVEAGYRASEQLAKMAVEESGFGTVPGKIAKNRFSTRGLWAHIRDMKTCGLIRSDEGRGVFEYGDPFGVIAAIIPTTNPTSTAMFKAIISVKSRNAMVTSPHPRAVGCINESIRILHEAAVAAGAPRDLITCMDKVSLDGTDELMRHEQTDLILATGGAGLVRAAYSSGKPAFGVGPGNSPAWIDRSADLSKAARCLVDSQTFDNGTICASEQSLVIDRPIREAFLAEMRRRKAHHCSAGEAEALAKIVSVRGGMNPKIVGLAPSRLAQMAGFSVPDDTTILLADCQGVGREYPLSIEKLCPILSMFTADGWKEGCERCLEVLRFGGMGHTLAIHCTDEGIIREFAEKKPVNRLVVNSPSSQGAVGFTTNLAPSMTLGCGSFGGNITSDNIGPMHLLNIKRLAYVVPEYDSPDWGQEFPDVGPAGSSAPTPRAFVPQKSSEPKTLWQPKFSQSPTKAADVPPAEPPAPKTAGVYNENSDQELRAIIADALGTKRSDNCPFGRCAECPPTGDCEKCS
ncbi:MAG: acetaldehyde dehydrogenase (acetylating) [Planctomycetota bacterium]|jgi:acetaldehyde dehydrogenase (acetylating)